MPLPGQLLTIRIHSFVNLSIVLNITMFCIKFNTDNSNYLSTALNICLLRGHPGVVKHCRATLTILILYFDRISHADWLLAA